MRSSRRQQEVTLKPTQVHHHDVKSHIGKAIGQAAAGDLDPNMIVNPGKVRGEGAFCRFHVTTTADHSNGKCWGYKSGANGSFSGANGSDVNLSIELDTARNNVLTSKDADGMPLSPDARRNEARKILQDMMENQQHDWHQNEDNSPSKKSGGWERPQGRSLTPSRSTRHHMRYESHKPIREAPEHVQESYHARQTVRFHEQRSSSLAPRARESPLTPRARSVTPDSGGHFRRYMGGASVKGSGHAGRSTDSNLRHDTPGGKEASLGRARSVTPDYHRRYGTNLQGSSLPGRSVAAAQDPVAPETPRAIRRSSACDPRYMDLTSSAGSRNAVRYHEDSGGHAGVSRRRSQDGFRHSLRSQPDLFRPRNGQDHVLTPRGGGNVHVTTLFGDSKGHYGAQRQVSDSMGSLRGGSLPRRDADTRSVMSSIAGDRSNVN